MGWVVVTSAASTFAQGAASPGAPAAPPPALPAPAPPPGAAPPPAQPGVVYTQAPPAAAGAPAAAAAPAAAPSEMKKDEGPIRNANNAVFLELLGNGVLYSINYERILGDADVGLRIGFSYIGVSAGNDASGASAKASLITVPLMANYYGVGGRNHKLQLGGGVTIISVAASSGDGKGSIVGASGVVPAPTLAIGYRYLPAKGGFTFFIGFTPFIIPGGDKPIFPWGGMSFGGVF